MTTNSFKNVVGEFINDYERAEYVHDKLDLVSDQVTPGDTLELPDLSEPTARSATTAADPEALTDTSRSLVVDQENFFNVSVSPRQDRQLLGGNYAASMARKLVGRHRNAIDENVVSFLETTAADLSGTYLDNAAAAALSALSFTNAVAAMTSDDGRSKADLAWLLHPYAASAVQGGIAGFIPEARRNADGRDSLGISQISDISGVVAFESNSLTRVKTVASTAYANVSTDQTITVPSGHGFEVGMVVSFDTVTAGGKVPTAVAITAVTATTINIPNAGGDSNATEAGTVTGNWCVNLLIDRSECHFAKMEFPELTQVDRERAAGYGVKVYGAFGRQVSRLGAVRMLLSPATPS